MYNYKVFLPTAGIGSRVKNQSNSLNKCLISIDNKPVISHIVEKFHPSRYLAFIVPKIFNVGLFGLFLTKRVTFGHF